MKIKIRNNPKNSKFDMNKVYKVKHKKKALLPSHIYFGKERLVVIFMPDGSIYRASKIAANHWIDKLQEATISRTDYVFIEVGPIEKWLTQQDEQLRISARKIISGEILGDCRSGENSANN